MYILDQLFFAIRRLWQGPGKPDYRRSSIGPGNFTDYLTHQAQLSLEAAHVIPSGLRVICPGVGGTAKLTMTALYVICANLMSKLE